VLRVVPIAPLAGRPRSAGWLRSLGRLFGMARTIAANAAYPSVGHIPLRRELDDATGIGAGRLIIDGKARTASASRDGTAFSAVAPREACLAHSQRSGTTKKDLLRSKPQIKACGGSSGTRQRSRFRCIRLGVRSLRRSAWRSRKVWATNSLRRIRPACTAGPASNSRNGLTVPSSMGRCNSRATRVPGYDRSNRRYYRARKLARRATAAR
jgi:hypothetical protein